MAFGGEGVVVTVGLRRRAPVCSCCGARGLEIKDRRVKRWWHLDLRSCRCFIECELRRLRCPDCGDRAEAVEWARAGSPYTRDFEDLARLPFTVPAHGSGSARRQSSSRPATPNRPETGHGTPKATRLWWIRLFSAVR